MVIKNATQKEFGEYIGISQQDVSRLVQEGVVSLDQGLETATKQYIYYLRVVISIRRNISLDQVF